MPPKQRILQLFLAAAVIFLLVSFHQRFTAAISKLPKRPARTKELVVASLKGEDTSWIAKHVSDWKRNIYIVNDREAKLTVPVNKGRESMVYARPSLQTRLHGIC